VRKPIFSLLLLVTLLPVPCSLASANVFTKSDVDALDKVDHAATALEDDINQSASTVNEDPTDLAQQQVTCLIDLENDLDNISARLEAATDLVFLSAVMEYPADEKAINRLLAHEMPYVLMQIALARKGTINTAAHCPTSALVNTYAQRTAALADSAAGAIGAVNDRVAAIANSPRHR
jgi:hypothetical protein